MMSQFAIDEIDQMIRDGLRPTPADIIRLNALGLKCTNGAHAAEYLRTPRIAYLGHLCLREPTLGHGEWLDQFFKIADGRDPATFFLVTCFALTRSVDALPDPLDPTACSKAVRGFIKKDLRYLTLTQIRTAAEYALLGTDAQSGEKAVPDPDELPREDEAVYAGRLYGTAAIGLGLSLAELRTLTRGEVDYIAELAFKRLGIDISKNAKTNRLGEFYATRDAIRDRLTKEKDAK